MAEKTFNQLRGALTSKIAFYSTLITNVKNHGRWVIKEKGVLNKRPLTLKELIEIHSLMIKETKTRIKRIKLYLAYNKTISPLFEDYDLYKSMKNKEDICVETDYKKSLIRY